MKLTPIKDIKPNPNNPRVIKDEKFAKLVQSLKELPEMASVRPVVVNSDMIVLGGNMRLKAMKEAGWKEVPVEIVDWDEDKQRQFIIKDNVGFGEWDWEMLANEWDAEQLEEWGVNIPLFNTNDDYSGKNKEIDVDNLINSSTPIPANYKTIIDNYITDYLCWMIVAHSGDVIKYRYMNKGVMEKNSDNSSPISAEALEGITKKWLNYAEQYGQNLIKYIENNLTLYPEYSTNTGHEDTPTGTAYDSPFIFPSQFHDFDIQQRDWWNRNTF